MAKRKIPSTADVAGAHRIYSFYASHAGRDATRAEIAHATGYREDDYRAFSRARAIARELARRDGDLIGDSVYTPERRAWTSRMIDWATDDGPADRSRHIHLQTVQRDIEKALWHAQTQAARHPVPYFRENAAADAEILLEMAAEIGAMLARYGLDEAEAA